MKRHGTSHGVATLASFLSAGLLLDQLKQHAPAAFGPLDRASAWIVAKSEIPYDVRTVSQLLLATLLAAIWGMAFAILFARRDRG